MQVYTSIGRLGDGRETPSQRLRNPRQGMTGYAELLYSITDNDQLFRDGSLEPTSGFLDSMTRVRRLLALFWVFIFCRVVGAKALTVFHRSSSSEYQCNDPVVCCADVCMACNRSSSSSSSSSPRRCTPEHEPICVCPQSAARIAPKIEKD